MTSRSIIHIDLYKLNNKLVSTQLEHFWCTDKPRANMDSQDSPQPELGGSDHLPPYNILCAWPWGQHPNVILSQDSQVESFEILEIGTPATLEAHKFVCGSLIQVRSKVKLQSSLRAFQRYVARHLQAKKSGRFPTFSGWESNWQFDFQPFFWS